MTGAGVPTGQLPRGSESPKLNPPSLRNIHRTTLLQRSRYFTRSIPKCPASAFSKPFPLKPNARAGGAARHSAPDRISRLRPHLSSKNQRTSLLQRSRHFTCSIADVLCVRFFKVVSGQTQPLWRRSVSAEEQSPTGGHRHARSGRAVPQNPPAKPRNREGFFKSSRRDAETPGKESLKPLSVLPVSP